MTISLLHHEPTAIELPCLVSNGMFQRDALTRNISMGGVWITILDKKSDCISKDNLGEFHIELDGYRIDIPSHFTRVYEGEYLVEFLTLTIEQKVILGFILNKQQTCSVTNSRF